MTQATKFVYESFEEFLSNSNNLSEAVTKSTVIMDADTSKDLIDEMIGYNAELGASSLERQAEKAPGTKTSELKKYAAEALKNKEYWKAAACNMFLKNSEVGMTKDFKVFELLNLNLDELKKLDTKGRITKFLDAIKGKDNEEMKESVTDDVKQNSELLSPQLKYSVLWQLVPEVDKDKVYADFERIARSKGYEDPDSIRELIKKHFERQKKDDRSYLSNPAIVVGLTKDQLEKAAPPLKARNELAQMLPVDRQHETFKPNKWGASANPADDYVDDNFEKMKENIGKILEERKLGRVTKIKSITVQTSCDRRRNTGEAENMSWGQLALARALSMASLVYEMAKKVELQPEEVETIQKMIRLDFMGANGDGSSGPNSDVNPGYYVKSGSVSKWVTVKDPSEIVIIPASEENGEPTKTSGDGAKTVKEDPIPASDTQKFNPYRYNNVVFDVEVVEPEESASGEVPAIESVKGVQYPIILRLPPRFKAKSTTIYLPSFSLGKVSGSPGKRPSVVCPSFGGKSKTSLNLGFEWKPVKVASWQSDITKQ